MRSSAENKIKSIAKRVIRTCFIDRKPDYLFSLLAPDVYFLGPGRYMQAEGRKRVEFFINKAFHTLVSYNSLQEKFLTKRLGGDHWLCEVVFDVTVMEPERENEQQTMHFTFIFRRCKNVKPDSNEWELIYIHHSATIKRIPADEMLAIRQANKTRRNIHIYDGLTEREKKLVQMLRNGMQIRDIAAEFGLAEITIKKALAKLYHRFNVKNRSRLCAYFDAQENNY